MSRVVGGYKLTGCGTNLAFFFRLREFVSPVLPIFFVSPRFSSRRGEREREGIDRWSNFPRPGTKMDSFRRETVPLNFIDRFTRLNRIYRKRERERDGEISPMDLPHRYIIDRSFLPSFLPSFLFSPLPPCSLPLLPLVLASFSS